MATAWLLLTPWKAKPICRTKTFLSFSRLLNYSRNSCVNIVSFCLNRFAKRKVHCSLFRTRLMYCSLKGLVAFSIHASSSHLIYFPFFSFLCTLPSSRSSIGVTTNCLGTLESMEELTCYTCLPVSVVFQLVIRMQAMSLFLILDQIWRPDIVLYNK